MPQRGRAASPIRPNMVMLYHITSLKPEIIRRDGLRPPRPGYLLNFLSKQLSIPPNMISAKWLNTAHKDPIFYDYLYSKSGTRRVWKNLFFWMFRPSVQNRVDTTPSELEKLALDMVNNSRTALSADQVRNILFTSVPSIVTVRIPSSWIWGARPGFIEWLTKAQADGEEIDIEIEVNRSIPPEYIVSID